MDEENLKKAFSKVKEDMNRLTNRISTLEVQIGLLLTQINQNKQQNTPNSTEIKGFRPSRPEIQKSSSGNKGVQSINHSLFNQSFTDQSHPKHDIEQYTPQIKENYNDKTPLNHSLINHSLINHSTNIHSLNIQSLKKELESKFETLTNQEFLLFLTIYQLEEDLGRPVTYIDLSTKLTLTLGCIRGYVSSIIRKNLPIIKAKINNRTLTLSINPEFRDLNLKEKLTNLYYSQDPEQTKLF
ncbi:hypothetical protein K8R33_02530 [archaeon]|nr:hypothetical protein [archaeon]